MTRKKGFDKRCVTGRCTFFSPVRKRYVGSNHQHW